MSPEMKVQFVVANVQQLLQRMMDKCFWNYKGKSASPCICIGTWMPGACFQRLTASGNPKFSARLQHSTAQAFPKLKVISLCLLAFD
uniref:Uncharacterized protein n=1 Tax=Strix occidentalis caurina TaxID=311401 RepID=A0A8D0EED1_STROC